ncbi:S-adenosyl-L-methionine-dependent methyltransferase, partial [Naematelia encephala]
KQIISSSYNHIAPTYHAWTSPRPTTTRSDYISRLSSLLAPPAAVLELGCGAGIPATRQLVELGYNVTGVDVSDSMIRIARTEVPDAEFMVSDMASFVPTKKYSCVMAFYSLWHLPPAEQSELLQRAAGWLEPGGWMLFNLMTVEGELKMGDWMGAPMISWGQGVEGNQAMVKKLVDAGLIEDDNEA